MTKQKELSKHPVIERAAAQLEATVSELANAVAKEAGIAPADALRAIMTCLRSSARSLFDARAAKWRVRVRLYAEAQMDEPVADTDPELAADRPGETVLPGLPAVAEHVSMLATEFHAELCAGLELETLHHKLRGLRPTISRRGGDAVWRLPYSTSRGRWLARADIVRE